MEITIYNALNVEIAFKELESTVKLPAKASYWLARLQSKLSSIIKSYYEARNKLVIKYGVQQKDENGILIDKYIIDPNQENWKKYFKEEEELQAQKETIEFNKMNIEIFEDVKLSKDFFLLLEPFIE